MWAYEDGWGTDLRTHSSEEIATEQNFALHNLQCMHLKEQESLADAKVSVQQQCMYEYCNRNGYPGTCFNIRYPCTSFPFLVNWPITREPTQQQSWHFGKDSILLIITACDRNRYPGTSFNIRYPGTVRYAGIWVAQYPFGFLKIAKSANVRCSCIVYAYLK